MLYVEQDIVIHLLLNF